MKGTDSLKRILMNLRSSSLKAGCTDPVALTANRSLRETDGAKMVAVRVDM